MLIQFSVENYLSFKNKAVFSMLAGKDTEHPEAIGDVGGKDRFLKAGAIYGANASGKSNLLNAMWFMVSYVLNSHQKQLNLATGRMPFKFDPHTPEEPSSFEMIFIHDQIKYAYGFSMNDKEVTNEYLYHYPHGRKALIFERSDTNKYRFTTDVELQTSLKERNTGNKLYLSTAANWNYEKVIPVFNWFSSCMFLNLNTYGQAYGTNAENLRDDEYRNRIAQMLRAADFGIHSLIIGEGNVSLSGTLTGVYDNIEAVHRVIGADGKAFDYALNMQEESRGTNTYLDLIGIAYRALESGGTLIADEIDVHLHPLLAEQIVSLFNSEKSNPKNAQLIFTTHNTNMMDLRILRRDQIWFTEKDEDTSASELFSLDEYSVRKDAKVERNYLLGRYGAIPLFRGGLI